MPDSINKKRKIIITIFLGLFLSLILIFLFYFTRSTENSEENTAHINRDDGVSDNDQGSTFGNLLNNDGSKENQEIMHEEFSKIISNGGDEYWQDWIYEEKMIMGVVQSVDKNKSEMEIIFTLPSNLATEKGRTKIVYIDCPLNKSALIKGSEPEQIARFEGVDVLEIAEFQDRLYTYCLDISCSNLGKRCILTDISQ